MQPRDQADLLAVVDLQPNLLGQHDRGYVRDESGADDLTHGSGPPLLSPSDGRSEVGGAVATTFFTSA